MRLAIALAVVLTTGACASAPLRKADVSALAAADGRVLEGCYQCLTEARDTYARVASGKRRGLVIQRLFEATLLVALRERELAMDSGPSLEQARALARELPPALDPAPCLDVVEQIPGHEAGWSQRRMRTFRRTSRPAPAWIDERVRVLEAGPFEPAFKRYVALSLDCAHLLRERAPDREGRLPELPPGAPPLLRYRVATCSGSWPEPLTALKADVPHFAEAALYLGRLELRRTAEDGGRKARALLREAYTRLARSPAVTFLNGSASQAAGDRVEALRYFDETLALEAEHEDALLGRTIALSHLQRHREAIDAATRILDLRTPDLAEACYWRAWNRHKLAELTEARADIDRARVFGRRDHVLTLAGIIEYEQDDLTPSATDLADAVAMNPLNCTALWYQALVQLKRRAWGDGAARFAASMTCYDTLARDAERQLEEMRRATNVDEEFRTRQIAGFEAAVAEDRRQASAAAYNAAVNYLRARDVRNAESYADRAALDTERADKVEELRKLIRERR